MTVDLNPYITFNGNAREAMTFYQSVFGGELNVMSFADLPDMGTDPSEKDKVMHAMVRGDSGVVVMAADTPNSQEYTPYTGSISLSGDEEAVLRGYWEKLSDGATINEPLVQAPWGDSFGMLTDKFGINWMVNIAGQQG